MQNNRLVHAQAQYELGAFNTLSHLELLDS